MSDDKKSKKLAREHTKKLRREDVWNRRFSEEGRIWGDEPSPTAEKLTEEIGTKKEVIEIGFGYGRDIIEMVKHGHHLTAVEESRVGIDLAEEQLDRLGMDKRTHIVRGEFTTAALPENYFDALLSHRVLHLQDNGLVRAFANKAHEVLKPGGRIYVSARDPRDFNADEMIRHEDGTAESKRNPGHIISFWDEERFRKTFGKKFEDFEFECRTEQESQTKTISEPDYELDSDGKAHPTGKNVDVPYCPVAYFTIMSAKKKL